jgi:hypothetical protein
MVVSLGGLAVAGGLVAWAFFGVHQGEEQETKRKEVTDRIFSAAAAVEKAPDGGSPDISFTSLEVRAKGEVTRLEKRDGRWQVVMPLMAPADRFAVDSLQSQLQTAKFKAVVEESPDEAALKTYGLDAPRFSLTGTATFPDGSTKTLKVEAGIDNPFDGSVYMRREGDKAVYAAEGGLRYTLEKGTFDLRDKELFSALEEPKLQRIRVQTATTSYELARGEKGWALQAPLAADADGTAIVSLVAGLRGERAQAFPEDSEARRKALGFDTPKAEALFEKDGETVRARFVEGEGGRVLALVESGGTAQLAELLGTALSVLEKRPADLRDKTVLTFSRDAVARITSYPAGGSTPAWVLEKARAEDGGVTDRWTLTAPEAGPARGGKILSLLYSLGNLKASGFVEDGKDAKRLGFGPDAARLELQDASGGTLATLVRGSNGSEGKVYVRGSRPQGLEVDGTKLQELFLPLADLKDTPAADAGTSAAVP